MDLSYNNLRVLESAHTHLGNIKTLNLSGNQLDQLAGLTKLYSLVNLDLSHNQLALVIPGSGWVLTCAWGVFRTKRMCARVLAVGPD